MTSTDDSNTQDNSFLSVTREYAIDYTRQNYDSFLSRLPNRVDISSLPKPNPVFRVIFGNDRSETLTKKCITERLLMARTILKRDLTQEETDAFAHHAANYAQFRAWGPILACVGAGYSWYKTRKTFAFTRFYVPKDLGFTQYFPSKKMPFYTGDQAKTFWQVARAAPITIAWAIGSITACRLWGNGFTTGRLMQDQRLKQFGEEFKAAVAKSRISGGPGNQDGLDPETQRQVQGKPVAYQGRQMPQQQQRQQQQGSSRGYEVDDASPTGGLGGNLDTWSESEMYSDSQMSKVEQEQTQQRSTGQQPQSQQQSRPQSAWSRTVQASQQPPPQQSVSDDFLFGGNDNSYNNTDDASPTAPPPQPRKSGWLRGNNASKPKPEQAEEAQAVEEEGSAWDRVRAQNMSSNGTAGMWGKQAQDMEAEEKGDEKKGGWRR